jgi:UDP-N-acetylglucosamine--N-acetylmuramyl-(pentapeptide) pyrophosphoryl-undecaprenol N-acetylglucosamine transferase
MKQLRIIISGGGSGGHIFPAIAIARSLLEKNENIKFLFVGAKNKMEMEKVPNEGFKIKGLWISGFQRRLTIKNVLFPLKLLFSLVSSVLIIKRFKPDLVIGTGGFASGPILYVASKSNIPTLIQEQNSYAGITNRILSKYVNLICVAYQNMDKFFPKEKICITGNPIRKSILEDNYSFDEAIKKFDLDPKKSTVLVIGGSLGARTINESILEGLNKIKNNDLNLIWQTGEAFSAKANKGINQINTQGISTFSFIKEIELAYKVADIIISRAGAIAISELCSVGKPVILVPSPNVAENHQYKNAQSLVNKNAALMVKDTDANDKLVETIIDLKNNNGIREDLSRNIKTMELKDASKVIADYALELLRK